MTSDLLVLQVKTLGRGHSLCQRILCPDMQAENVRLLDFVNLSGECILFILGPESNLNAILRDAPSRDLVRSQQISGVRDEVLKSLFNLETAKILNFSVIIEGRFIGDLLKMAQACAQMGLGLVELQMSRRAEAPSSLIVTAKEASQEVSLLKPLRESLPSGALMTVLSPVCSGYAEYFS